MMLVNFNATVAVSLKLDSDEERERELRFNFLRPTCTTTRSLCKTLIFISQC